ncbi:50S ribosomal protein L16 [Candidatus Beckwithbacteria bacterium CG23_combo_of_CG06-09_8_20_14_all_34_8]|uniref:Large ribosomal subunit protein uL16 n=1 Tax=Candidatus Beckwithbacteria bacterium CG23_combo_of_CG06-09_8_20_14_all_34_8 TaxID=1974497 RepID=A0A2H0B6P1_9BACT|nr:MAG: 50S ribosomal protein L16 [Candidatus Beckwithbacteria bacterium CG23_combo_of_CG06-09_8_20_14_all_34_8]
MQPKRTKYRKQFRGKRRGMAVSGSSISFGDYALKALQCGWIPGNQIEAARKTIANYTKRQAKVWIRIFPDKPITKRPAGSRMGSGKGDLFGYVAVIRPGRVMLEVAGVTKEMATEALRLASRKFGIKTRFEDKHASL